MRQTARLTVRQHRFGFALVAMAAVALAIAGVFLVWLAFGPVNGCRQDPAQVSRLAEADLAALQQQCEPLWLVASLGADYVASVSLIAPLAAALLLTAPLIAVELELGTATLAWSLARTRRSWLLPRLALVAVVVLALGVSAGLASDAVTAQTQPGGSPWASLYNYDSRGAVLTARTLLVAAAGLFAGALAGRQLPALVLGAALAGAIVLGVSASDQAINRANEVVLSTGPDVSYSMADLYLETQIRDIATGEITSWLPAGVDMGSPEYQAHYRDVSMGIPASQAGAVVRRNVAFTLAPAALLLGLTFVAVERRRPYLS